MIFFTDENIPKNAAYMLDNFERNHEVRAYYDYFDAGTPDTTWIPGISSWDEDETIIAVCADGRILRNEVEKQALKECNLTFVHLARGWTHLKWEVYGWKIVKIWPEIVKNVEQARYPMIFEVPVSGSKVQSRGRISNL